VFHHLTTTEKEAAFAGLRALLRPGGELHIADFGQPHTLYTQLAVPCVPMALNSGLFWQGWFVRRAGTVVLEYLDPIPPGLPRREFMALLESRIEEATNRLLAERRQKSDKA
jgi:1-acyl-sn-glycerol-3-phosphate acyltransferase